MNRGLMFCWIGFGLDGEFFMTGFGLLVLNEDIVGRGGMLVGGGL